MNTIDEKLEEIQGLASKYIKTIAMDIVVVLVALAYVFYQMVKLEPTELNPLVLIAQAFMGIVCGVVIKQSLGENGFSRGHNSKTWQDEEEKYNETCQAAIPYMEYSKNFYQYEEIDKKKNYRYLHLQEVRLRYDQWFDKDGFYIGCPLKDLKSKGYDRKQIKTIKKCVKVKIYPLNLFGKYIMSTDQDTRPEITEKGQRRKNILSNTVTATGIAIIGAYFVPMITNWSWASFVAATMQVTLWVLLGMLQLYQNFNFVVQDLVAVMRKKKEDITRFISGCEKHKYDYSPYEEIEHKTEIENAIKLLDLNTNAN